MNRKLSITSFIFIIAPLFFACNGPAKDEARPHAPGSPVTLHAGGENYYLIDTIESVISWKGSNSFGVHRGFVNISKGELLIETGQLTGGAVEVDMKTIQDESHQGNNGVIQHLKDPDFFYVKRFPIATIDITKVESIDEVNKMVTGNLTIKNITQDVSFPASVEVQGSTVKATGKLVIDRTRWGVRYQSGKFFSNLADKTISDSIEFDMKIVAKK